MKNSYYIKAEKAGWKHFSTILPVETVELIKLVIKEAKLQDPRKFILKESK
jgi:hypothetical protein